MFRVEGLWLRVLGLGFGYGENNFRSFGLPAVRYLLRLSV